jgi:RNA polymerase sigma-70 factor (ECF subfamily)
MKSINGSMDFVKLINENQGLIHKVCLMYESDEEDRKDLFQEIVIQLWRAFPSFKGQAKFSTWMYRVAINTAITNYRTAKRKPETIGIDAVTVQFPDSNESTEKNEQLQMLQNAIKQLSEIDRAIVMLYFEEVPYEEIAETVGISVINVRVKMTRIREKLKQILIAK